jgi:hypothetical protein
MHHLRHLTAALFTLVTSAMLTAQNKAKPSAGKPDAEPAAPTAHESAIGMAMGMMTASILSTRGFPKADGWTGEFDETKLPNRTPASWRHEKDDLTASFLDYTDVSRTVDEMFASTRRGLDKAAGAGQLEVLAFEHDSQAFVGDGAWTWIGGDKKHVTQTVARAVSLGDLQFQLRGSRRLAKKPRDAAAIAKELLVTQQRFAAALDAMLTVQVWNDTSEQRAGAPPREFPIAGGSYRLTLPHLPGWSPEAGYEPTAAATWTHAASERRAELDVFYRPGEHTGQPDLPAPGAADPKKRLTAATTVQAGALWFRFAISAPRGADDAANAALRAQLEALVAEFALAK